MISPKWLVNRLRAMGPREIAYRVAQKTHGTLQSAGIGRARAKQPEGQCGNAWCVVPTQLKPSRYAGSAQRILDGHFMVFALHSAQLGMPPIWNRCPRTDTNAPLRFGKTLNYRDEAIVGDIKYLWEPARHLEVVTLAQAWRLTGDASYLAGVQTLVDSWIQQCPYPYGAHWTSSLEHSVRLVNWAVAWHLAGGERSPLFEGTAGAAFRRRWLTSVYQHLHFISGHFSRHSSANNHLLGELMGLFIGVTTWPMWRECQKWQEIAQEEFEEQALLQNSTDGVNREQAPWYHHEVADMMLLCRQFGTANRLPFSKAFDERLEKMLEFITSIMDRNGSVPLIGDADDAVMVRFSQEPDFNPYRSLLATGAVLFGRPDFAHKAGRFDDKTRWLLGDAAESTFEALLEQPGSGRPVRAFPEGGYWVLGDGFDTDDEVRIVADAGPLGYLSIAAHGHADALAFTLSAQGKELLIDSGTYAYHTHKRWRDYFRGTSAHNTVRVDGLDQSVIAGNFMWSRHAAATCHAFVSGPDEDLWDASHDGYRRLADPVTHRRCLSYRKAERVLVAQDVLECRSRHRVELFWHFHPECLVTLDGNSLLAERDGVRLELDLQGIAGRLRLMRGSEEPIAGWYSARFDEKQPTTTAVFEGEIDGSATLTSRIRIRDSADGGRSAAASNGLLEEIA